jgi:hypothetical protein
METNQFSHSIPFLILTWFKQENYHQSVQIISYFGLSQWFNTEDHVLILLWSPQEPANIIKMSYIITWRNLLSCNFSFSRVNLLVIQLQAYTIFMQPTKISKKIHNFHNVTSKEKLQWEYVYHHAVVLPTKTSSTTHCPPLCRCHYSTG